MKPRGLLGPACAALVLLGTLVPGARLLPPALLLSFFAVAHHHMLCAHHASYWSRNRRGAPTWRMSCAATGPGNTLWSLGTRMQLLLTPVLRVLMWCWTPLRQREADQLTGCAHGPAWRHVWWWSDQWRPQQSELTGLSCSQQEMLHKPLDHTGGRCMDAQPAQQ